MAFDVAIIGAGAAGLMCAAVAGRRGRRVIVFDHATKIGEKIRISGGGRCNFTNINSSPENFLSANPRFCVSALKRYPPARFMELIRSHGIAHHEKTRGQMFCDGSAGQIIDMLLAECRAARVKLRSGTAVNRIDPQDGGYRLVTDDQTFDVTSLVIATGGLSIPKIGASDFGHRIAKQFGLPLVSPRPGLVPLILDPRSVAGLAGVALPVAAACGKTRFIDDMLFTHRGLSGPAILQISSYWHDGDVLRINMAPGLDLFAELKTARSGHPKRDITGQLARILPKRLARHIGEALGWNGNLADLSDKKLRQITQRVQDWQIIPSGTEGYKKAEVTLGGVDTAALSSKTMACKARPDLFFIGEVVDVTGHLGGHNFQWAWASAQAAGQAV